ncbi:hypothetical protein RFI_10856 [Reticulomyxa filosa]|uniref:Uncharacterized protein n=1 Tax=Reticulomyxa filosa TaxID=46433 RepID=X6NJX9_RETFI|nr:hypothetical protein RFI_10856 [Reticulomyxa filosa]|eukprot:ETO26281.1 hypothetical protein RFI_10856 [Reticulomyxa filosa]
MDNTYAIVIEPGVFSERYLLPSHQGGLLLASSNSSIPSPYPSNLKYARYRVVNGWAYVDIIRTRHVSNNNPYAYSFDFQEPAIPFTTIGIIYAVGTTSNYRYHGFSNKGKTSISLRREILPFFFFFFEYTYKKKIKGADISGLCSFCKMLECPSAMYPHYLGTLEPSQQQFENYTNAWQSYQYTFRLTSSWNGMQFEKTSVVLYNSHLCNQAYVAASLFRVGSNGQRTLIAMNDNGPLLGTTFFFFFFFFSSSFKKKNIYIYKYIYLYIFI